ncbi:MAG: DUF1735 domain-containing protein [Deinococcales bacterium]|nr:DUF1735 domain-containing protein [Chitinophagaceae bacterium]
MKKAFLISFTLIIVFTACNKKNQFDDYKYSTVYFPYQSPVRTLELGEDLTVDNSQDNMYKFSILATMGGVYENKKDITIVTALEPALAQNLKFNSATGDNVVALPPNYYTLPSNSLNIVIPSGSVQGGVDIQLTDAFFADPRSIKNTFVLPLRIKSVTNADSILKGSSTLASPDPRRASDWVTVPKDYVLYAIKYINPYHGAYLRRGIDKVTGNSGNSALDTTVVYHNTYVEQDEVTYMFTKSLTQDSMSLNLKNKGNLNTAFMYVVNFDNTGKCTVTAPTGAAYTVSGTGEFVKKGDSWGNQQRDVLRLKYTVNFATTTHSVTDTLVMRDRQVKFETFSPFVY